MKNKVYFDIEPYNFDSFGEYDYCFFVGYFTSLKFQKYDLNIPFVNSLLKMENNKNSLFCSSLYKGDYLEQVHKKYNIDIQGVKINEKKKYVDFIKKCLDNQILVITTYISPITYDPSTKGYSEKYFDKHFGLIFGYDDRKKEFDVVNHIKNSSMIYKKCKISYRNLVKAHYKAELRNVDENSFYIVKPNIYPKTYSIKELTNIFNDVIKYNKSIIEASFRMILSFLKNFLSEGIIYKLINSTSSIIYFFNHERLIQKALNTKYIICVDEILKHLKLLRNCIFKVFFSKNDLAKNKLNSELDYSINLISKYASSFYKLEENNV